MTCELVSPQLVAYHFGVIEADEREPVEAHLTRVYRRLGVQSRTELARVDLDTLPGA